MYNLSKLDVNWKSTGKVMCALQLAASKLVHRNMKWTVLSDFRQSMYSFIVFCTVIVVSNGVFKDDDNLKLGDITLSNDFNVRMSHCVCWSALQVRCSETRLQVPDNASDVFRPDLEGLDALHTAARPRRKSQDWKGRKWIMWQYSALTFFQ